ncbi:MAG TPA: lactate dehydrogenase [Pseudomonas sp.]|uniref:lactate dehydrogenase n=1 Tax=Pseudomonas sp. TaxID=306 RepID=UPI002EDAA70A
MTSISAVNQAQLLVPKPATTTSAVNDGVVVETVPSPAAVVILGQETTVQTPVYSSRGLLPDTEVSLAWETEANDKVSTAMLSNFTSSSTHGRFQGLGAALLAQLASSGSGFSQSLVKSNGKLDTAALSAAQSTLHTNADNSITLSIKTVSGATVNLSLTSQADGLAVQANVTGGTLTDDELAALADLADGFQSAIDGFTAQPPKLDLGKLTQYDTRAFSAVDLNAQLKVGDDSVQSLSLHADSNTRSVTMSGPSGNLQMAVDMKNSAILGDADQQAKALQGYLKQFDAARQRGHGDAELMSLFTDTFTALNSHYPDTINKATAPQTVNSIRLTDVDHAMLNGLADFTASVTQSVQASNPMQPDELDAFAYQVSQTSETKGTNQLNRTVEQDQQSHLTASYHQALYPGSTLKLGSSSDSQNYAYYQIEDKTSSSLRMAYDKGRLIDASVSKSTSHSTRVSKYEMGRLIEDTLTPEKTQEQKNYTHVLEAALQEDRKSRLETGRSSLLDALASIRDQVMQPAGSSKFGN